MKTHHPPTRPRRKRRADDLAGSSEPLRAAHPIAAMQRAVGNAAVERALAQRYPVRVAEDAGAMQRAVGNTAVERALAARGPSARQAVPVPRTPESRCAAAPERDAPPLPQQHRTPAAVQFVQRFLKSLTKAVGGAFEGIKKGATAVWGGVKKGAAAVWGSVKKGAAAVWGTAQKAAGTVWSGVKWVTRPLWSKLTGIFHRTVGWFHKLPARLSRLFTHLWNGVKSLKPWSLKWWLSLGQVSTWKGLLEWLGVSLIQILEVAGVGEMYETLADFIKFNTRPLTVNEIAKAKVVFGNSIPYRLIRVDNAAVLGPAFTGRAYVSFHTINAWGPLDDHTLIHELTHVWQYERMGAVYMPKALHAQKTGGYDYGGIPELKKRRAAGKGFSSFNLEQQGQITGDYYIGVSNGSFSNEVRKLYEHFVKDVRS